MASAAWQAELARLSDELGMTVTDLGREVAKLTGRDEAAAISATKAGTTWAAEAARRYHALRSIQDEPPEPLDELRDDLRTLGHGFRPLTTRRG